MKAPSAARSLDVAVVSEWPGREPEPARSERTGRPNLRTLTGLRFWAAFHVLVFHLTVPSSSTLGRVIAFGPASVGLFFVLSGFILSYTYLDGAPVRKAPFWQARFARIYPVYLIGVLIALADRWGRAGGVVGSPFTWWPSAKMAVATVGVKTTLATLVLVQSWHPDTACQINCVGWSLSVEAFFYLMFPVLAGLIWARPAPSLLRLAVAAWLCSLALATVQLLGREALLGAIARRGGAWDASMLNSFFAYWPLLHLPEFFMGMIAGRVFIAYRERVPERKRSWTLVSLAAVGATLGSYALIPPQVGAPMMNGALAPLYALLVFSLAAEGGVIAALFGSAFAVVLGEMSYALYLLHPAIASWYSSMGAGGFLPSHERPLGFAAECAVILALSYVVFRSIEEPARHLLRPRRSRRNS